MAEAIRKTIEDLRAVIAYKLVRLATRIYPPLPGELVEMTCHAMVKQGEKQA